MNELENVDNINIDDLYNRIVTLIENAKRNVATKVNDEMTLLYWNIGKDITDNILNNQKAEYGKAVIKKLSQKLTIEYGRGYSRANLFRMLKFYEYFTDFEKFSTLSRKLSWSHFVELLQVQDKIKREFYATMCANEYWSVRTLRERIGSALFERTAISKKPEETKRYFETAYQFVTEYKRSNVSEDSSKLVTEVGQGASSRNKNLGEQYIISAKVHMDEETPHMHLIFLPVVHTKDKKGNDIEKLACSEFWKAKDSYRQLQDAFYKYMTSHNFGLDRGVPKEETGRNQIDLKDYKEITNFDKTKEKLQNMKLELPSVPEISDININRLSKKRDEKILEEIIKPKDDLINELYQDKLVMHQ